MAQSSGSSSHGGDVMYIICIICTLESLAKLICLLLVFRVCRCRWKSKAVHWALERARLDEYVFSDDVGSA